MLADILSLAKDYGLFAVLMVTMFCLYVRQNKDTIKLLISINDKNSTLQIEGIKALGKVSADMEKMDYKLDKCVDAITHDLGNLNRNMDNLTNTVNLVLTVRRSN